MNFLLFAILCSLCVRYIFGEKKCEIDIEINNCYRAFSIRENITFLGDTIFEGCNPMPLQFDWDIISMTGKPTKDNSYKKHSTINEIKIDAFQLRPGKYKILVAASNAENDLHNSDDCDFEIKAENPIPIIKGGPIRKLPENSPIIMNGAESKNMNLPVPSNKGLQYNWTCKSETTNEEFTIDNFGSPEFTITDQYSNSGAVYVFTLYVKTEYSQWQSVKQTVKFITDRVVLSIRCVKNCSPLTTVTFVDQPVILEAGCTTECTDDMEYKWNITMEKFNYKTNTKYDRYYPTFYINPNVLEEGKKYKVSLETDTGFGHTEVELKTHIRPTLKSCRADPAKGVALKTNFHVKCVFKKDKNQNFEISSKSQGKEVVLISGNDLHKMEFVLPANSTVNVKLVDQYGYSSTKTVNVQVTAPPLTKTDPEEMDEEIEDILFSASSDLKDGNIDKAIQNYNVMADESSNLLKDPSTAPSATKAALGILQALDESSPKNIKQAKQFAAVSAKLANNYEKADPDTSELATSICKTSAQLLHDEVASSNKPEEMFHDIKDTVRTVSDCFKATLNANPNALESKETVNVTQTPFPLLDVPVITEHYPDYVDDQNISKAISKLDASYKNMVDMCYINSKTLSMIAVVEQDTQFIDVKEINITSTKKRGEDLLRLKINSHGVQLRSSKDFKNAGKKVVEVVLCTLAKNPLWWKSDQKIFTSVAILKFTQEKKTIDQFSYPFDLSFEDKTIDEQKLVHYVEKPPVDGNLSVYRVDVYSKRDFYIQFHNLTESDEYRVVVKHFAKPTLKDFEKASIVNEANPSIHQTVNHTYNSWFYFGILPASQVSNNITSQGYSFSVYTVSCYTWNVNIRSWVFACEGIQESYTTIHCRCYHASVFAGKLDNNDIRLEVSQDFVFELELQVHVLVYSTVAVVFFLYCLFLSFIFVFKPSELLDNIYLVSDAPHFYKYAYLIIVRTGSLRKSGTTSNVSIKVFGTLSESNVHVLNYPDPEKRLLQRNGENWFVLPTEIYLGEVNKIEMWIDAVGKRPNWFCSEIQIRDMQEEKSWRFNINSWLDITKENIFCEANPTNSKEKITRNKWKVLKNIFRFKTTSICNVSGHDAHLPNTRKLSIFLSTFMFTFASILVMYSRPNLTNSDSLNYINQYGLNGSMAWITLVCFLLSFLFHFPIVYYLRYVNGPDYALFVIADKTKKKIATVCWILLTVNILLCMTLMVLFGFWVPFPTSALWLTAALVSLLVYIVLLEKAMDLIHMVYTKAVSVPYRLKNNLDAILEIINLQRKLLYHRFGKNGLRPYLTHLHLPLDDEKKMLRKEQEIAKQKMLQMLEDLVMIVIYVVLLYVIILVDKYPYTVYNYHEMISILKGQHVRAMKTDIQKTSTSLYFQNIFPQSVQPVQWYDKYISNDPGAMKDFANKYLGIVRLRQHRTVLNSCRLPKLMEFLNVTCRPEFYRKAQYDDFSVGWGPQKLIDNFSRMHKVWKYTSQYAAGSFAYGGKFAWYPGGGYIAPLGRTLKNSMINIKYLMRNNWIDELTRCVFVEFLCYNPNNNLFTAVSVKFEHSATGFIKKTFNAKTSKLVYVQEDLEKIKIVIYVAFIANLILIGIKLVYRLTKLRRLFFSDLWYVVDICIVVLTIVHLAMYGERIHLVNSFIKQLESVKHNEFINYFHLFHTDAFITLLAGLLVFIATIRLWKLLRFMVIFRIVEKTLKDAACFLLGVFLVQIVFVLGAGSCGITMLGSISRELHVFPDAVFNLFLLSLGMKDDFDLSVVNNILRTIYYIVYMFGSLLIYTVYISIITIYYAEAQAFYSEEEGYSVSDYLREQFQYYLTVIKIKFGNLNLRGGEEYIGKCEILPKNDDIRYADCIVIPSSTITNMVLVSKCVLRNRSGTATVEQKLPLMMQTVVALFKPPSETKEIFFTHRIGRNHFTTVDDTKIQNIHSIAETMLHFKEHKQRKVDISKKEAYEKHMQHVLSRIEDIQKSIDVLSKIVENITIDS